MKDFLGLTTFQLWTPKLAILNTTTDQNYCRFGYTTIKVTVRNDDAYTAENLEINVPLPANTAFNSAQASVGSYSSYCAGNVLCQKWVISSLAVGASAELSLRVFALANSGNMTTTATILTENTAANGGKVTINIPDSANCGGNNLIVGASNVSDLKAFPNPTNDKLNVEMDSKWEGKGTLNIYDSKGSVILSKPVDLFKGFNSFNLETSKWINGNYYLIIQGNDWASEVQTIVKM